MRCLSCDRALNNLEATRKYYGTMIFVDLCNSCFAHVEDDLTVDENPEFNENPKDDLTQHIAGDTDET